MQRWSDLTEAHVALEAFEQRVSTPALGVRSELCGIGREVGLSAAFDHGSKSASKGEIWIVVLRHVCLSLNFKLYLGILTVIKCTDFTSTLDKSNSRDDNLIFRNKLKYRQI